MNYLNFKNEEDLYYAKALYEFAKTNNKGNQAHAIWTIWHWLQLFYIRQQELLHIKPIVQIGSVSLTGRIQLSSRYVGTVCGLL